MAVRLTRFPPGVRVAYETGLRENAVQQLWVVQGRIDVMLGEQLHVLHEGDCLAIRLGQPALYSNPTSQPARYIVAISDEQAPAGTRSA